MAQTDLKIRRIKMYNPVQKKYGFATRAIINGTETFDSVAEEAARNTTLNKYELAAALDADGNETATRDFLLADYRFENEADKPGLYIINGRKVVIK